MYAFLLIVPAIMPLPDNAASVFANQPDRAVARVLKCVAAAVLYVDLHAHPGPRLVRLACAQAC